jgi:phage shock protein A
MARALLTNGEKKAIRGDSDVNEGSRSTQLSRVRKKIEQMRDDAQFLREHDEEMYDDLREAVVGQELEERLERMEEEIEDLRKEVEDDGDSR